MGVKWSRINANEWDAMPSPVVAKKPNQWDEAIQAIIDGEIVAIPVDEKDVRGIRIGMARRASSQGVKLSFRHDATKNVLAVRLSPDLLPPKEEKPRKKKGASSPQPQDD